MPTITSPKFKFLDRTLMVDYFLLRQACYNTEVCLFTQSMLMASTSVLLSNCVSGSGLSPGSMRFTDYSCMARPKQCVAVQDNSLI